MTVMSGLVRKASSAAGKREPMRPVRMSTHVLELAICVCVCAQRAGSSSAGGVVNGTVALKRLLPCCPCARRDGDAAQHGPCPFFAACLHEGHPPRLAVALLVPLQVY